jgi:methionyl aminopeptidase
MLSKILPPKVVSLPDADGHFNPFPAFMFTGSLRPVYPLSPRRTVPEKIRHPDYAHNGIPRSEQVCPVSGRHFSLPLRWSDVAALQCR